MRLFDVPRDAIKENVGTEEHEDQKDETRDEKWTCRLHDRQNHEAQSLHDATETQQPNHAKSPNDPQDTHDSDHAQVDVGSGEEHVHARGDNKRCIEHVPTPPVANAEATLVGDQAKQQFHSKTCTEEDLQERDGPIIHADNASMLVCIDGPLDEKVLSDLNECPVGQNHDRHPRGELLGVQNVLHRRAMETVRVEETVHKTHCSVNSIQKPVEQLES